MDTQCKYSVSDDSDFDTEDACASSELCFICSAILTKWWAAQKFLIGVLQFSIYALFPEPSLGFSVSVERTEDSTHNTWDGESGAKFMLVF